MSEFITQVTIKTIEVQDDGSKAVHKKVKRKLRHRVKWTDLSKEFLSMLSEFDPLSAMYEEELLRKLKLAIKDFEVDE